VEWIHKSVSRGFQIALHNPDVNPARHNDSIGTQTMTRPVPGPSRPAFCIGARIAHASRELALSGDPLSSLITLVYVGGPQPLTLNYTSFPLPPPAYCFFPLTAVSRITTGMTRRAPLNSVLLHSAKPLHLARRRHESQR